MKFISVIFSCDGSADFAVQHTIRQETADPTCCSGRDGKAVPDNGSSEMEWPVQDFTLQRT
jgi:hypothetical protein